LKERLLKLEIEGTTNNLYTWKLKLKILLPISFVWISCVLEFHKSIGKDNHMYNLEFN